MAIRRATRGKPHSKKCCTPKIRRNRPRTRTYFLVVHSVAFFCCTKNPPIFDMKNSFTKCTYLEFVYFQFHVSNVINNTQFRFNIEETLAPNSIANHQTTSECSILQHFILFVFFQLSNAAFLMELFVLSCCIAFKINIQNYLNQIKCRKIRA